MSTKGLPPVAGQGLQGILPAFDPNFEQLAQEGGFFVNGGGGGTLTDFTSYTTPDQGATYAAGHYGSPLPITLTPANGLNSRRIYAWIYTGGNVRFAIDIYRPNQPRPDTYYWSNSTSYPGNPSFFDGTGTAFAINVIMAYALGAAIPPDRAFDPQSKNLAPMLINTAMDKIVLRWDQAAYFNAGYSYVHYFFSVISSH